MTNLLSLTAISPIDGRYRKLTEKLADYFSESALIKYRTLTEVEYFISLCKIPLPQLKSFDPQLFQFLRNIYTNFTQQDAQQVKDIEKTTNHDVKAVEYFLKQKFQQLNISQYKEFIHFGLTSQDINNTAVPLSLKQAWLQAIQPVFQQVQQKLAEISYNWKHVPMLARTHGQPASPTTVGKELYVFVERLQNQANLLKTIPFSAKFGGATGNFNAHKAAYPQINWIDFADNFINNTLGLNRLKVTTQIEHYDNLAAFCNNIQRINTILLDLNKDIWTYISFDYFKQKIKQGEVGSSAMPHKVNPIDFENSEGNIGIANAIFHHLAEKLPISRLQRDLTDSTITRNIGVPLAHTLIGFKSLLKGLGKLILNEQKISQDLQQNYAVVAEAVQTILRREGYQSPYEKLKELTRTNQAITQQTITDFIQTLDISETLKQELLSITPHNYIGICDF